jgi:hypothetical protein
MGAVLILGKDASGRATVSPTASNQENNVVLTKPAETPPKIETPKLRNEPKSQNRKNVVANIYHLDFPKPSMSQSQLQILSEDAGAYAGFIYVCLSGLKNGDDTTFCNAANSSFVFEIRNKLRNASVTIDALENSIEKIKKGPTVNDLRDTADILDAISQRLAEQAKH